MLCLLLKLSLPQANAGENSQSAQHTVLINTILVIGDSISAGFGIDKQQGWVALLENKLQQQTLPHPIINNRIINASISGETTSGGANRISKLLQQHNPSLVIIELGGNDGLRGSPIKLIKQNLSYMIKQSQQSGADVLLLGMQIPPNYGQTYSKLFAHQYQELATTHNVGLVPFLLQGIAGVEGMMQADGIHPTQPAQIIMLNNVYPAIKLIK
tara:strand:- start:273 stop:914 length:642 start_codon:yes stop_codon:yes gene_type:complete